MPEDQTKPIPSSYMPWVNFAVCFVRDELALETALHQERARTALVEMKRKLIGPAVLQ